MPVLNLAEVNFGRFPTFLGNGRTSGVGIGNLEVMSKTFKIKRFARNEAFREMQIIVLSGILIIKFMKTKLKNNLYRCWIPKHIELT
jgi:hypothetical protein